MQGPEIHSGCTNCLFAAAGRGALPVPGQAVAFFRRGAILLNELSAVTRSPLFYRLPTRIPRGMLEEDPVEGSLAAVQARATVQQSPNQQHQQLLTGSLTSLATPQFFRPTSNPAQSEHSHQPQERRTQELLVRALQYLIGIGAESLQLLDVDGEVRHFSVLYEKLHFKW